MSYEYGSSEFKIRNPFRLEGLLTAIRGVVLVGLGVVLLLEVRSQVEADLQPLALTYAALGVVLTTAGLMATGRGMLWMFRFFVGRGVPSGLAREVRADRTDPGRPRYKDDELAAMLMGRKNLTFQEPSNWLARAIHTLSPNVIFVPPQLFRISMSLFAAASYTVIYFLAFALACASGLMGLTRITETPVMDWLGWFTVSMVVGVWLRRRPGKRVISGAPIDVGKPFTMAMLLAASILVPTALIQLHIRSPLPEVPLSPIPALIVLAALTVLAGGVATLLVISRAPRQQPATEVSEYRAHWQESAHPMDIFRAFDMALADHRVLEMPNRVYRDVDPQLIARDDKGSFHGDILAEIQPEPLEKDPSSATLRLARISGIALGQILLLVGGLVLFQTAHSIEGEPSLATLQWVLFASIVGLFGNAIAVVSHWYSAEIYFASNLVQFIADGTFTESRVSTGTSVFDSNRSENTVIRSSITPWILCGRSLSSTLAVGGSQNLEQTRFLHAIDRSEILLNQLTKEVRGFLAGRQVIADISSDSDLRVAAQMHSINEQTRATPPQLGGGQAGEPPPQVTDGNRRALSSSGWTQETPEQ